MRVIVGATQSSLEQNIFMRFLTCSSSQAPAELVRVCASGVSRLRKCDGICHIVFPHDYHQATVPSRLVDAM